MARGAAEGRSSWACQSTLNGIPNAEWYVLALSFVHNHIIHTLTPPPPTPTARERRRLPRYVECYVAPPRVVQAGRARVR